MTRGYAAAIEIKKCGNPEPVALVLLAMEALDLPLPERLPEADLKVRRFSMDGAVVVRGTTASVFIGGTLIGLFETDDDYRGQRNVLAVTLAKSDQFHLGRLANAFGMTDEHLRPSAEREDGGTQRVARTASRQDDEGDARIADCVVRGLAAGRSSFRAVPSMYTQISPDHPYRAIRTNPDVPGQTWSLFPTELRARADELARSQPNIAPKNRLAVLRDEHEVVVQLTDAVRALCGNPSRGATYRKPPKGFA